MIKKTNKSSLFLMELIIAILFFSLSSAVCIQVFMKARDMNTESLKHANAAILAANIAEVYKSDQLDQYYHVDDHGFIYFDEDLNLCSASSYTYKAVLKDNNNTLSISILYENKELYSLKSMHYKQRILDKDVI